MNYYQLIFKPRANTREFYEGKTYIFKSDLELERGDFVVALTQYGYSIAVVYEKNEVEVSDIYSLGIAKIICKLEGNYYKEKEREEKLKEIRKQLEYKADNLSEILRFESLAKYDAEAQQLLNEYKELTSQNVLLPSTKVSVEEEDLPF